MKKIAAISIISLSLLANAFANGVISSFDAKNYDGQIKTVCGPVAQITKSKKATFINFDKSYPNQTFTGVIWKSDRNHSYLEKEIVKTVENGEEQNVCIEGRIKFYKGIPNITIDDLDQVSEN